MFLGKKSESQAGGNRKVRREEIGKVLGMTSTREIDIPKIFA